MQLATGGDDNAVALTDAYDWYIMPVVNPDGYAYSWTNVWQFTIDSCKFQQRLDIECTTDLINNNFNFSTSHFCDETNINCDGDMRVRNR